MRFWEIHTAMDLMRTLILEPFLELTLSEPPKLIVLELLQTSNFEPNGHAETRSLPRPLDTIDPGSMGMERWIGSRPLRARFLLRNSNMGRCSGTQAIHSKGL